jgi:hypothetical protein
MAHDGPSSKRFIESSEPRRTKRTWNRDPRPSSFTWSRATGSEGKSGGLRRWACGELNLPNALIWRGIRTPEGEWRQAGRFAASDRSGFGEGPMGYRRSRPGAMTSRWGARKRAPRCGRAKGCFEITVPIGNDAQTGCGASIRIQPEGCMGGAKQMSSG